MSMLQRTVKIELDMSTLPHGTLVEFDEFSALVVGDNLLLVFMSDSSLVREGSLLRFSDRGPNDWVVSLVDDERWSNTEYWISRDWNGHVNTRYFDEYDDFWNRLWEDDDWLYSSDEYDHIYEDNDW